MQKPIRPEERRKRVQLVEIAEAAINYLSQLNPVFALGFQILIACAAFLLLLEISTRVFDVYAKADQSGYDNPLIYLAGIWDENHDGTNTCEEWKAYLRRNFLTFATSEMILTADTFERFKIKSLLFAETDFEYFNLNGDNRITMEEVLSMPNPIFIWFDDDRDCAVKIRSVLSKF